MPDALVIAGCLSGEAGDAGAAALVRELAGAVGAGVTVRARTGGRPVGAPLPTVLSDLRRDGARSVLVVTTHVAGGYLQRAAASAVRAAASGFEELRLAPPLLADEGDAASVAAALDAALPARPGRLVALAGHRGVECEAALALLESALWARGREDALVGAPDRLAAACAGARGTTCCSPRSSWRSAITPAVTYWETSPRASPHRRGRTPSRSFLSCAPSSSIMQQAQRGREGLERAARSGPARSSGKEPT